MGDYTHFDFTEDFDRLLFKGKSSFTLTKFPGSDNMIVGQPYEWIVPNTFVIKTSVSPDGTNVLRFGHIET